MYLKLQYCVSCAIHGKIVRYANLFREYPPAYPACGDEYVYWKDPGLFDQEESPRLTRNTVFVPGKDVVTASHRRGYGITRTERRSTLHKPRRAQLALLVLDLGGRGILCCEVSFDEDVRGRQNA